MDVVAAAWFIYIVANSFLKGASLSLSLVEFAGLALMYVVLRFIPTKRFSLLFIALMAGGLIQAVYGNLQLWGYYPSHHNLFKLTGSFFNPGPYAGFLAVIFPVAFCFWLYGIKTATTPNADKKDSASISKVWKSVSGKPVRWLYELGLKTRKNIIVKYPAGWITQTEYYLSAVVLLSFLLVLPASQSRAAWLAALVSSAFILTVKNKDVLTQWLNKSAFRKTALIVLLTGIMVSGLAGMYFLKKDSADGRVFIWKITLNMISDNPLTGAGFGGFKANYMNYQAAWFEQRPQADEAMVAGDVNYAFNELLQQTAEHGAAGTFLLVMFFLSALLVNPPLHSDIKFNRQHYKKTPTLLILISKALLISFVIFSMFSYPIQILPVKMGLVLALAYLAAFSPKFNSATLNDRLWAIGAKITATGIVITILIFGTPFIKLNSEALKDWNYAFSLYNMGAYEASVEEYKKAQPVMKYNGDFLTNYGKALSMAGQHKEAVSVLLNAGNYFPNTVVYTALGDSYKAIGHYLQAEAAYLHAGQMNTGRFYPKYLLAKLYNESGQREKAVAIAQELLTKEVKVESTAIEEIRAEMQKILEL